MWLSEDDFRRVVDATPLVSIDLIVQNSRGEILLGKRLNRPARGLWFVPGGRIQKGETLDDAFRRLMFEELGLPSERSQARLLGVYEHFYADSVFGDGPANPSTHYVVMAYQLHWQSTEDRAMPLTQHAGFQWWGLQDAAASKAVHQHTKAYIPGILKG